MARIEGTQSIPSALKYEYDGTLTPLMPNAAIRSRNPWRIPKMQEGGSGVSEDQKKQRGRIKAIITKFKTLTRAEKERWYAAAPPWGSLLFYYNYFMMSGLMGNATVGDKGGGVIKSIQHKTFTLLAGAPANVNVVLDTIDPLKSVVFFYGSAAGEVLSGVAIPVYAFLVSLAAELAVVKASLAIIADAGCSLSVIEYI